eukprot:91466-Prorocentrum_minimum.AAC.2
MSGYTKAADPRGYAAKKDFLGWLDAAFETRGFGLAPQQLMGEQTKRMVQRAGDIRPEQTRLEGGAMWDKDDEVRPPIDPL